MFTYSISFHQKILLVDYPRRQDKTINIYLETRQNSKHSEQNIFRGLIHVEHQWIRHRA